MSKAQQADPKTINVIDHISVAQLVFRTEANGLLATASALDLNFIKAVETIHKTVNAPGNSGKLITAGIGKSGAVAQKIAATMSSMGTPAFFINPNEASHGDLGAIGRNDIVLLLSNSGESPELTDLVHYTRHYKISLIAMTGNPNSALAKHADIGLIVPKLSEACPHGLAPTTSTTVMMAYGDALAVALAKRADFTPQQFRNFHPGGKLGVRLKKVGELMIAFNEMAQVTEEMRMSQVIVTMAETNQGSVVVTDQSRKLKGIITDGDIKRLINEDGFLKKIAGRVMSDAPKTIGSDVLAVDALRFMGGEQLTTLVVEDRTGKVAGIFRMQDCISAGLN